jgi:hypothetical protein
MLEWVLSTLGCHPEKISEWQQRSNSDHSVPADCLVLSAKRSRLQSRKQNKKKPAEAGFFF